MPTSTPIPSDFGERPTLTKIRTHNASQPLPTPNSEIAENPQPSHCPFRFLTVGPRTFLNTLYPQLAHVGSGSFANSAPVTGVPHRTHSYFASGKIHFFPFSSDNSDTPD